MSTTFDTLFAACATPALDTVFGEYVTLQRASHTTSSVPATWFSNDGQIETTRDIKTSLIERIWLVKKAAYLISAAAVEPRAGDRIIDSDGAEWEVLPANIPSAASYGGGESWQVNTKRVKA